MSSLPVLKPAEVIRKLRKTSDLKGYVETLTGIRKFLLEPPQLALGNVGMLPRRVDLRMFDHGREHPASQHIPSAPVGGGLKVGLNLTEPPQSGVTGLNGFRNFSTEACGRGHETIMIFLQQFVIDPGLVIEALGISLGRENH